MIVMGFDKPPKFPEEEMKKRREKLETKKGKKITDEELEREIVKGRYL